MKNIVHYSNALLAWSRKHGRYGFPWQHHTDKTFPHQGLDPYRVWIAEIMLQQTQVQTVIPYFQAFMKRFSNIHELAKTSETQVLHAWSGLGYYQRARNLHRCARLISEQYQGHFPKDIDALQALPGIGRSTAGAIGAACFGLPSAILDGNVRRVLCRLYAIDDPPSSALEKQLWALSTYHTPKERTAEYNQAMMDLGATICRRSSPKCDSCPICKNCRAKISDKVAHYPVKKAPRRLPERSTYTLIIENIEGAVFLEKRPSKGVWPHLWSLPEIDDRTKIHDCLDRLRLLSNRTEDILSVDNLPAFTHRFSHYALQIKPLRIRLNVTNEPLELAECDTQCWYRLNKPFAIALPQPILKLLHSCYR